MKWLKTIAKVIAIAGASMAAPEVVPVESQDTSQHVANIIAVVLALLLRSPRDIK